MTPSLYNLVWRIIRPFIPLLLWYRIRRGKDLRRLRIEPLLHGAEDVGDIFHVHYVAVGVEHFNEAAHMRAFEMMRQIDKHSDSGDGVLMGVGFVADADGETQVADAHLVDAQFAVVALLLNVGQRAGFINVHCG